MFSPLLYYLFVLPVSYLPIQVLYGVSNLGAFFFNYIYAYRGKVLEENLRNSFPEKSDRERVVIKKQFYRHFADIIVESIKNISASRKFLLKRISIENPEIVEKFYQKNKSVLLVSGHYNNWEYLITAQNLLFTHQAAGIGMPLSNKFWDKKLNAQRKRFGMHVIHAGNVKEKFKAWQKECIATLVLADQSPSNSRKSYWMDFLHQKTAVLFGAELLAKQYDQPVVFFTIHKKKRGYYSITLDLITEEPRTTPYGYITEQHTRLLEQQILRAPEYWIWTHKRWKREVPEDLEQLRTAQKNKFLQKMA